MILHLTLNDHELFVCQIPAVIVKDPTAYYIFHVVYVIELYHGSYVCYSYILSYPYRSRYVNAIHLCMILILVMILVLCSGPGLVQQKSLDVCTGSSSCVLMQ